MSRRRILGWVAVFVSGGLALLGMLVFIIGVGAEFINTRSQMIPLTSDITPTTQVALAGLCLAGLMALVGFGLVMVLLARQTRRQAPGYGDAYRFMEHLQFKRAIPVLERAIESGRETPEVLAMLTSAYAHNGQFGKAQAAADRAVQLFPDDPSAYITLANGYRLQASYEQAAEALEQATHLAPHQPIIWAELGFVQRLAGDARAAFKAFQKAAEAPMPAMYSVRVYHHLARSYQQAEDAERASSATAKMMSARHGLDAWEAMQEAMQGTAYGQALRYEIQNIAQAIAQADAASVG